MKTSNNIGNIQEIKRLLGLYEIAQAKVEFNNRGTQVTNPMQQASANRIYNRVYKLKGEITSENFAEIHREVIKGL